MNLGKNATLVGGAIFVIAASIFVEIRGQEPLPVEISNTLELRQALFMARTVPPPGSSGVEKPGAGDTADLLATSGMITDLLSDVAGRPFISDKDCLTAAAAAAALDARHLVPLFAGPLAAENRGAAVMVRWALDPTFRPGLRDLDSLRSMKVDRWAREMAVSTVMRQVIPNLPEQHSRLAAWNRVTMVSGAVLAIGFGLLVWGMVSWFKWRRRQLSEVVRGRDPAALLQGPFAGLFSVYIWFTAWFLAVNLLVPEWLKASPLSMPFQAVIVYLLTGVGGFVIVAWFGRTDAERNWRDILGFRSRIAPPPPPWTNVGGLHAGLRGYAMIWPVMIVATFLGSLLGDRAAGMDNPVALFLATNPGLADRIVLVLSAGLLAPIFEEPIFRGFFYRRLRGVMTPYGAAAASGFIFAAAHFSSSGFISLWAIGFTLALTYESSGRLRSSMVAHALWNMGTAAGILVLYG